MSVPVSQAIRIAPRHHGGTLSASSLIAEAALLSGLRTGAGAGSLLTLGGGEISASCLAIVDGSALLDGGVGKSNSGRGGSGGSFLLAATSGSLTAGDPMPGQKSVMGTNGGVINFKSTNNHSVCASAGRRPRHETTAAGTANSKIIAALFRPMSKSVCMLTPINGALCPPFASRPTG